MHLSVKLLTAIRLSTYQQPCGGYKLQSVSGKAANSSLL